MLTMKMDVICQGGPLDGQVLPAGTTPWAAWVPRATSDRTGPPRNMKPEEVFGQDHYRYAGVRDGKAIHVWTEAQITDGIKRPTVERIGNARGVIVPAGLTEGLWLHPRVATELGEAFIAAAKAAYQEDGEG